MYLVDARQASHNHQQLRMPYFKSGLVMKDFMIKRNQLQHTVIIFLFKEGEVACIQKLNYGEGVLKKTVISEALDIALTLCYVGCLSHLKRLLRYLYSRMISMFK